jgi:asparagine synthase (glutamine-hydrolysing)
MLTTQRVTVLPSLLRYADRNSMAHSVEVRLPFLDHRVTEFAFRLPADYKIRRGVTKRVLRAASRELLPETILRRSDKIGFAIPTADWLRYGLRELGGAVFSSRAFRSRGLFAVDTIQRRWDELVTGEPGSAAALWRALSVELWFQEVVDAA